MASSDSEKAEKAIDSTPPSAHQTSTVSSVRVDGAVNIRSAIA